MDIDFNADLDPDLAPTFLVNADLDPVPDQEFCWPKIEEKKTRAENFVKYFFDQKLQFTYL